MQPVEGPSTAVARGGSPWSNDFLIDPQGRRVQDPHVKQAQAGPSFSQQTRMDGPRFQQYHGQQYPSYQQGPQYGATHFGPSHMDMGVMQQPRILPAVASDQMGQTRAFEPEDRVWTEAFTAYDPEQQHRAPVQQIIEEQRVHQEPTAFEADQLAETAGRLVSTVEQDQNDKFKQSNFLNLMRKLRDREAGIQGSDIVESVEGMNTNTGPQAVDKGKARAIDATMEDGTSTSTRPRTQHEAYLRMQQAQANGLQIPLDAAAQESGDREWLNDLWAEEDARSAAIEEQARQKSRQAFLGDGGDVAARMREDDDLEAREFAKYQSMGTNVLGAQSRLQTGWEEDIEADEASKEDFVGRRWEGTKGRGRPGAQAAEWDKLQADWDAFEAGPMGLRASSHSREQEQQQRPFTAARVPSYQFQEKNPYLAHSSSTTRTHSLHSARASPSLDQVSPDLRSILESEAAVQMDPNDASAWYSLGVKQQENERETSAIAALHKSVELDPGMQAAWLALAVSYTNENNRIATFESIERWIDSSDKYRDVVRTHRAQQPEANIATGVGFGGATRKQYQSSTDRHGQIVSTLLSMARHGSSLGEVDADVQVALGVLFNASDDFSKAVDCFSSAISVRPDDWLLYNRLGAVLSNSGRSEEALEYYRWALELKPDFARCHFNLAISCLNLKRYEEAARHCYAALVLQQTQEEEQQRQGGGESGRKDDANRSLWETLRISLELQGQSELAQRTRQRDISMFDGTEFE